MCLTKLGYSPVKLAPVVYVDAHVCRPFTRQRANMPRLTQGIEFASRGVGTTLVHGARTARITRSTCKSYRLRLPVAPDHRGRLLKWCRFKELNLGRQRLQRCALPTELNRRVVAYPSGFGPESSVLDRHAANCTRDT